MDPVRLDHAAEALASLPVTLDKPAWRDLVAVLMGQIQAIEDAAIATILQRALAAAEGVQIDLLGKLVGQPRDGRGDADYKRVIGAKIAVNVSQGLREDLIRVARMALLDPAVRVVLEASTDPGGDQTMLLSGLVDHEAATDVIQFARRASQAGVRIIVESWPVAEVEMLRCDDEEPGAGFAVPSRVDLSAPLTTFDSIIVAHPDHSEVGLTLTFVADPGADPAGELDETGYPDLVFSFVSGVTTITQAEGQILKAEFIYVGQPSTTGGVMNDSDDDFGPEPFTGAIAGGVLATSQDGRRETYPGV